MAAGWKDIALCKDMSKIFFSSHIDDINEAKSICEKCPAFEPCLEVGMRSGNWLVFAGTSRFDRIVANWKRIEEWN
jgi:hypothetical protein